VEEIECGKVRCGYVYSIYLIHPPYFMKFNMQITGISPFLVVRRLNNFKQIEERNFISKKSSME